MEEPFGRGYLYGDDGDLGIRGSIAVRIVTDNGPVIVEQLFRFQTGRGAEQVGRYDAEYGSAVIHLLRYGSQKVCGGIAFRRVQEDDIVTLVGAEGKEIVVYDGIAFRFQGFG